MVPDEVLVGIQYFSDFHVYFDFVVLFSIGNEAGFEKEGFVGFYTGKFFMIGENLTVIPSGGFM